MVKGGYFIYNCKIIEYPNGSAQIRLYSNPIDTASEKPKGKEWDLEPFTGTKVREVKEISSIDSDINRKKSLARTKSKISTYARCAVWEYFVTLTFDPKRTERGNFKECMRKTRNWLHNMRKRFAADLQYLVVPELHADGVSWHIHALFSNVGNMIFVDSGRKKSGQIIYNLAGWRWGFSTATKVRDVFRIQKYITKYMTKECHALASGAHRYYVSQNLSAPKISTMLVDSMEQEELINQITESLGMKISYRSKPTGDYVKVTYVELQ